MTPFALVLSGGGAAAIGQVPVLEALDEAGVGIAAIAGTSMGAVIGALRAAGMSGRQIRARITDMAEDLPGTGWRVLRGLDWSGGAGGRLLPDPLRVVGELLAEDIPETIEELDIPFVAIATDYYGQRMQRFDRGPLRPALAASFAIPGALRPVRIDGRVFVDGGVSNNLPISELPGGAPVLAVDVATNLPADSDDIPGPLVCAVGSMRILMRALLEARLEHDPPDILIRPESAGFGPLEFHRVSEILEAAEPARQETREAISRWCGKPPPVRR